MMDTQEIRCGASTLMEQASMTAHDYLIRADQHVNDQFSANYCKQNPEFRARMISAFMQATTADFNTALMKLAAQDVRNALQGVADALRREVE